MIDADTQREINRIAEAAIGLAEPDQLEYLDRHCQSISVRTAVERLLLGAGGHGTSRNAVHPAPIPSAAGSAPGPGELERYRRIGLIATGGRGQVSLATDTHLDRMVAFKEIRKEFRSHQETVERFRQEARITGRLEHPGVVPLYAVVTDAEGDLTLVMRRIDGATLSAAIDQHQEVTGGNALDHRYLLKFRQLLNKFVSICDTVQFAHDNGIIHRDLKPDNIMLGKHGETYVVDWGLAQEVAAKSATDGGSENAESGSRQEYRGLTQEGAIVGTLAYMSPEQADKSNQQLTPATDIYSLGATLYCLLTGHPPYRLSGTALSLDDVQNARFLHPHEVSATIPRSLESVCLKAMSRDPGARYASARAMSADIERWLAGEQVVAYNESLIEKGLRFCRKHSTWIKRTSILVLLLSLVFALISLRMLVDRNRARDAELDSRLRSFLTAEPQSAGPLLGDLRRLGDELTPFVQRLEATQLSDRQQVRLKLIRLPSKPEELRPLLQSVPQMSAAEVELLAKAIQPRGRMIDDILWSDMQSARTNGEQRLRTAALLAVLDPNSSHWLNVADQVSRTLVQQDSLAAADWSRLLEPVSNHLAPTLLVIAEQRDDTDRSKLATQILVRYANDDPIHLASLVARVNEDQFAYVLEKAEQIVSSDPGKKNVYLKRLATYLDDRSIDTSHNDGDIFLRGESLRDPAQAAVALLRMEMHKITRRWLLQSPTPAFTNQFILTAVRGEVHPTCLVEWLSAEEDASLIAPLLLVLGHAPPESLAPEVRRRAVSLVIPLLRTHPDPGIHSAAEWMLRSWNKTEAIRQAEEGSCETRCGLEPERASRRWRVNSQNQTMIIIDDPSEFLMGSPDSEVGRTPLEFQHRRRPGRPFEIASKEVTREQFARFLLVRPAMKYVYDNLYRPDDTRWDGLSDFHPQGYVQWYEAAAYCNWLSELEGLPESELCFIPNVDGEYAEGMGLAPDYLRRLGYRLPTECEWEYACRSGTSTVYYHGDSDDVHHRYANYLRVPSQTSLEVGSLLPNTWGLFDSLGNVSEWCMHRYRDYQLDVQAGLSTDFEDMDVVKDHVNRVVRGGGYANNRQHARAAGRVKMRAFDRYPSVGFRVARTRRRPAAPDPDQLREEVILSFDSRRYESAMAKIARLPNLRDDTELLAMQGHCYGTLGMPSEAIESLRQAHAAGSTAVDTWYCLGILYVQDGHITQFEDLRSTMRDQFAKVGDSPATAARARNLCFAVRPSLIVPDTTDNAATAVRCAQYAVDFAPNDYWYRSCLAMAQYRAGNLTDAVTNLRQAIRDHNGRGAPIDLLFLSMASQQLGRSTEAREFLERAVVLMDEARKMQGAERWLRWWDSVEFDIVLKEARQMNDQTRITGSDSNSK